MTVRFQITITKTYEVDLNDLYRDYQTLDVEEAMNIDLSNMAADPGAFLGEVDGDEFQVAGKVLYPDLPIVSHKTKGGMCCNGKRGCGGPGSYCCSKTVYTHRHDDGSTGPLNLPQSPEQVRWESS